MDLSIGFKSIFNSEPTRQYFAPGRVNLIGEHTDYNGGHVFPCAIDRGTFLAIRPRLDRTFRFYSENFSHLGIIEIGLDQLTYRKEDDWTNYPKGVIKILSDEGYGIDHGFDCYYYGTIPNGAGLSSSASIELVTAVMLDIELQFQIDRIKLCLYCQRAENTFIGVNCGIMDQFAIGMGKNQHAILLDTNNLIYGYAPLKIEGYTILVSNTNKRRGLADSKYNERRSECEEALSILQTKLPITSLGDLTINEFESNSHLIENPIHYKRAKHAVYENQRTLKAKKALELGDLKLFGQLMNESHISLRDDYEVTGLELDTLVELAWNFDGVIGSRMTGAGFGGCTVTIIKEAFVESFEEQMSASYESIIGYKPSFYRVLPSEGARKL